MSVMPAEPMAKKTAKRSEKVTKPAAPEPSPSGRKPMVVQIRGSEVYKEWAEAMADREGFTVALLFERAMREFAEKRGYPLPPKR